MSEPAPEPGAAPAAPTVPETPPAAAKPPEGAPNPDPTKDPAAPDWLPDRLAKARESERKKLLQDVGVEDPDDLKAKLARLRELEDQTLSEQERTKKQIEELTAKSQQFDALQKTFTSMVESEFSGLTEQQQQAIDARAAGDAQRRWEIMDVMKSAGLLAPPAPAAPKPASTSAPGAAPPPASPKDPQSPRAKYEALKASDPLQAELYRSMHARAIESSPS